VLVVLLRGLGSTLVAFASVTGRACGWRLR
jgi:hypothetical protein